MIVVAALCLVHPLVEVETGDLPILLTAPHGGTQKVDGAPARTGENQADRIGAKKGFSIAFDANTDKLAHAVSDVLYKSTGHRPYLVVARFSRKYIDANRPAEQAYETDAAKATYDAYHGAIQTAKDAIVKKWGVGLLLDLHGQGSSREKVFRGTANLATVNHLVGTWGRDALTGKDGLLGILEKQGWKLSPTNADTNGKENPALNGGWTVRHYGSLASGTFDAVQLELGASYRRENLQKSAENLALAIEEFSKRYLERPAK